MDLHEHEKNIIGGLFSGVVSSTFMTPIEYLKIQKQAIEGQGMTYFKIIRNQGLLSIFNGYFATVLRDVPGWCSYFFAYKSLKKFFDQYSSSSPYISQFMAGGFAGQISWACAYPADVVKSYIQYHNQHTSVLSTTRYLYSKHGIRYFFKGLSPCLLRAFQVNSVVFVAYEYTLK